MGNFPQQSTRTGPRHANHVLHPAPTSKIDTSSFFQFVLAIMSAGQTQVRKDGGPDGRGVGFYFRNVTELILFGVRGPMRTLKPGRTQVNILSTRKREHSRKPDELYDIVEGCSPGPYLELFARHGRPGWSQWGDQIGPNGKSKPYISSYSRVRHEGQMSLPDGNGKYSTGNGHRRKKTLAHR